MPKLRSLAHQFELARQAMHETDHLHKAKYWMSCVSNAYQVALRSAAGLLYGMGLNPLTEREVRIAFASAFVSTGKADKRLDDAFRRLEKMRHLADFDHDHTATKEEADEALRLAHEFWDEAQRLRDAVVPVSDAAKKP